MNLCDAKECTGCLACYNACSHSAIKIESDILGFRYPKIIANSCVECGLCASVCPILNPLLGREPDIIFSGWSKDNSVRIDSSSGGAFSEIARFFLERGGVVFGCVLDPHFRAVHTYIENVADLPKLRRSKYVQSNIAFSYSEAKRFLKVGRQVLFSGTPCQIAGLLSFLKRPYENLYTVDLVCHGVPSPQLWEEYKAYIEKKEKMKVKEIRFREKTISWIFFRMLIKGENGKVYEGSYFKDRWLRVFLSDYYLRESCYNCRYCSIKRVSDFTIADWWGYKGKRKEDKGFRKGGVSLVLVNTLRGYSLGCLNGMSLSERTLKEAVATNKSLTESWGKPKDFESYRGMYPEQTFEEISNRILRGLKLPLYARVLDRVPANDVLSFLLKLTRIPAYLEKRLKIERSLSNKN